jgi:hypothetical protein
VCRFTGKGYIKDLAAMYAITEPIIKLVLIFWWGIINYIWRKKVLEIVALENMYGSKVLAEKISVFAELGSKDEIFYKIESVCGLHKIILYVTDDKEEAEHKYNEYTKVLLAGQEKSLDNNRSKKLEESNNNGNCYNSATK